MYAKCIKCGSEKTHGSRVRPGERTIDMLFRRPVRCRECKERFWVRDPNAYLTAGAMVAVSALFISVVWLIIKDNMSDQYTAKVSQTEPEQPAISDAAKPNRDPTAHLGTANSLDVGPFNSAQITAGAKTALPPTQKRPDDHHFAVQLYQESAENGDSDAQYKLGLLYLTGNGALQDFAEAAKWLKLAAEQGYALAQYELGLIYRSGYGLATDQVQSYMWLNLAAAAGIKQAVIVRDEVMKSLNTKQLAQAQKISRDWLASRPKPKPDRSDPPKTTVQPAITPLPLTESNRKQRNNE
jgi:uncharacterized protein